MSAAIEIGRMCGCGPCRVFVPALEQKHIANYRAFLQTKAIKAENAGKETALAAIDGRLYDFQAAVTRWALLRGRAAVFADTGLGKTPMQVEWARHVGGRVLILAPLCVAEQTQREAKRLLDTEIHFARDASDLYDGLNISNYEMLKHFIGAPLDGIVLDESSILKSLDGKTRGLLLAEFTSIPYRLCCTATPCPNDIAEIANHAEFLGIMKRAEMLAAFFVHDDEGWRLRGHAREPFYRWMASWAMALKSPDDIGFDGSLFKLPKLTIRDEIVETEWRNPGSLFAGGLKGIVDRSNVRQMSAIDRASRAAELAKSLKGQVIVWCGLNSESKAMAFRLGDQAIEVEGSQSPEEKAARIRSFLAGEKRILVTKSKIAGFGMNFQNAHSMIFLGLSDSYESYYQCIRRCWRYGQKKPVEAYVIVTDHEREIVENVRRKEREADTLSREIINAARRYEMEELGRELKEPEIFTVETFKGPDWTLHQGDCVEVMAKMPDNSVDLSVFSPPFSSLYTYSASERDIGNVLGMDQFFEHFGFVIDGLMRVTKRGRLVAMHIAQSPATLSNDGFIGLKDLRGRAVEEFVNRGWIYQGEVVIDKDPQAQAIRTHAKGLLFVQLKRDASWLRPALADYILVFRKLGENVVPIQPDVTNDEWIEFARPIWYGIKESDTLNVHEARENNDDRHICPLQLGTIERCIRLWSNKGETIFSPFAGIGSEGYVALQQDRRFIGTELKPRYAEVARQNLERALSVRKQIAMNFGAAK